MRGLTLNGAGFGANGIVFSGGTKLAIIDCAIANYTAYGISVNATAHTHVLITSTVVSESVGGIVLATNGLGTMTAVLSQLTLDNNTDSIELIANGGQIAADIANSQIGDNSSIGVYSIGATGQLANEVILKNVTFSYMPNDVYLAGATNIYISRVVQSAVAPVRVQCINNRNAIFSDVTNHMASILGCSSVGSWVPL